MTSIRCRGVKVDTDDATDDGDRRVVTIDLSDGIGIPPSMKLVAWVELPPGMTRKIAEQLLSAADEIEKPKNP